MNVVIQQLLDAIGSIAEAGMEKQARALSIHMRTRKGRRAITAEGARMSRRRGALRGYTTRYTHVLTPLVTDANLAVIANRKTA